MVILIRIVAAKPTGGVDGHHNLDGTLLPIERLSMAVGRDRPCYLEVFSEA